MRAIPPPPRHLPAAALAAAAAVAVAGCGAAAPPGAAPGVRAAADPLRPALAAPPADAVAVPIGRGARFELPPTGPATLGLPVRGQACLPDAGPREGAHVEVFVAGRVVVLAPGIGIAHPVRRGAQVTGGRCSYPLRTVDPSGVVQLRPGTRATLRDLFALWGRPLTRRSLAGFRGDVRAYVDGRRVAGDPARIALTRHRQVVLAVGPRVPVHPSFRFPGGL